MKVNNSKGTLRSASHSQKNSLAGPGPPEQDKPDAFKVYVRVRPLNSRELAITNPRKISNIIGVEDATVPIPVHPSYRF